MGSRLYLDGVGTPTSCLRARLQTTVSHPAIQTLTARLIMIVLLQVIVVFLSFFVTTGWALLVTSALPVAYVAMMGYGTLFGGREIVADHIARQLHTRWADSNDLAEYMKKYWYWGCPGFCVNGFSFSSATSGLQIEW
jgi:hypothetical protein